MTLAQHQPDTGPDAYFRDAIADSMRYAGDVSHLLQNGPQRWTDALLSEVRAHLSGCLNTVEAQLAASIGEEWLARPVQALGPNYCRLAIERHPAVLSPLLLDHLRQRGAAAIALRMTLDVPTTANDRADIPDVAPSEGALADALAAFRLSVDPWFLSHPLEWPMRPDLAAEPFCDLVWAATALLVEGLTARMGVAHDAAMPALARAAEGLIARHDEQAGPFARAAYAARIAQAEGQLVPLAEQAVLRRELLLLAGLGGVRVAMPIEQVLAMLVDGEVEERAALARLLGLGDAAYIALLDALAPVQEVADDSILPDTLTRYRDLSAEEAMRLLARWRGPAPLVARLSRMGWTRP